MDNEIYEEFRQDFPDFKVDVINEEDLKSAEAKEASFKEKICYCVYGDIIHWIFFGWKLGKGELSCAGRQFNCQNSC